MKLSSINLSRLAPESDLSVLYEKINDTVRDYPRDKSIVDVFRETAARDPQKTAVRLYEAALSYGELDARSNQVGNWLKGRGVVEETVVAIYMDRSIEMVVAILGVLKAGGAYLPLNIEYPTERNRYMVQEAGASVLIGGARFVREINQLQWLCPSLHTVLCPDSENYYGEMEGANPLMKKELWEYVGETARDDIAGGGWTDSYTGEPFSRESMDEYARNAYLKLKPYLDPGKRVLEIGCASGITMYPVAAEVSSYYGTDLSASIIEYNRRKCVEGGIGNVRLACLSAEEVGQLAPEKFDIIIINSVIQAFNGLNYLRRILRMACGLLNEGGILFIGDVMDLEKKDELLDAVRAFKLANPQANTKLDFSNELFVPADFFRDCVEEMPGFVEARISPKIFSIANELTDYRYDVILEMGKGDGRSGAERDKAAGRGKHKYQFDVRALRDSSSADCGVVVGPGQLSNIMFTSGSTGAPKGVLVEHGCILRLVMNSNFLDIGSSDSWLQTAEVSFDPSCMEIFGTLLNGATLCLAPKDVVLNCVELRKYMEETGVTILQLVSALFHTLAGQDPGLFRGVRKLVIGGEVLSARLAWRVMNECPGLKIVNAYGPTENCVVSTAFEIDGEYEVLPIGKPISNSGIYILNEDLQLQPVGVAGELYLRGDGLARGYLGGSEKDAGRFMDDPFVPGGRMYRTGDLARLRPDLHLEFIGRKDAQVKINGHRVELTEIENAMKNILGVSQVVVTPRGSRKALCGYLAIADRIGDDTIRQLLAMRLPEHMIPRHIIRMDAFPMTTNGKIDVNRLPEPEVSVEPGEELVEPKNELERRVVEIFRSVLGKEKIGTGQHFFRIGGHSLLATQVLSRINKELEVHIKLKSIFNHPTAAGLAEEIERSARTAYESIPSVQVQNHYALSHAQERLWVMDHLAQFKTAYNISDAYEFRGELDREALERAFRALTGRHEILRTVFPVIGDHPKQRIIPAGEYQFQLGWQDLSGIADKEALARQLVNEEAGRPFDLEKGPLLRAGLVRMDEGRHVFVLSMHHIIGDGWSLGILIRELLSMYNGDIKKERAALAPLPIQYKDYAAWQNKLLQGASYDRLKGYWTRQLGGTLPVLRFPLDRPRSEQRSARAGKVFFTLSEQDSAGLRRLCSEENATLFMCLSALIYVVLYKYTGQTDILIGTPIAGRDHRDLENQLGLYINTLVLRSGLEVNVPFNVYLQKVKETTLDAYEHQQYPFDILVEDLHIKRVPDRSPLFDVGFTWQNIEGPEGRRPIEGMDGLVISSFRYDHQNVKTDIWIHGWEQEDGLIGLSVSYNLELLNRETIDRVIGDLRLLAGAASREPGRKVSELAGELSSNERKEHMENHQKTIESKTDKFFNIKKKTVYTNRPLVKESCFPGESYPVVITPELEGLILQKWIGNNRAHVERLLREQGGILFRGFGIGSMAGFQEVASVLSEYKMSYMDQSSPRTLLSDKTYTSTDHPEDQVINMHNELSYSHDWPMQILFYCEQAAAVKGETPIADSRKVLSLLQEGTREKFREKGILYVRNLVKGFGLSWQEVYQTEDRTVMEQYCRDRGIQFAWTGADNLRISWKRPAIQTHPVTGEEIWFNHGFFFNAVNLDESIHEAVGSRDMLPFNTFYGDGTEMEKEVLAELREAYEKSKVYFKWQQGDILLLDNMLMAHGRNSYSGARKILVAMNNPFSQLQAAINIRS